MVQIISIGDIMILHIVCRSQLMVIDYQRVTALKEMNDLTEQLQRARQLHKALDQDAHQRQRPPEIGKLSCGISPEEVI